MASASATETAPTGPPPSTLTPLRAAVTGLRRFLADADPRCVTTTQAVALLEAFVELERLASAGKILFAARAAESTVWVDEGHSSAATWLAEKARGSFGEALSTLDTSKRLASLDDTAEALRAGQLSGTQAQEVSRAAAKDPAAEQELLELADEGTLKQLKERARQVMAQASSKEEETARYRAIYDARFLRHYTDHDGAFRLDAKLTPDAGARVLSSIQSEADTLFDESRQAGRRDRPEAYRADALVGLLTGEAVSCRAGSPEHTEHAGKPARGTDRRGEEPRRRVDVVVRIDAAALVRGSVAGGEVCEVAGVGPVPVATARALLPDAWVKLLVTKGVDVANVCHVGRMVSTHVESALEERDRCCVVPGCDVVYGLEKHHFVEDFASSGTTKLSELARVCRRHHDMVTYDGFVLGGGPGKWRFAAPPDAGREFDDTG